MHDVVVIGSANLDLVVSTPRIPGPGETVLGSAYHEFAGGKGLNQAIAASRAGAATALIGAMGTDDAARHLRDVAGQAGVDLADVRAIDGHPTGRALITVDEQAENSIVVVPGANALATDAATSSGRVLLAQLEIPLEAVADALLRGRAQRATTIVNPAPATDLPDALLGLIDVIVPNEHEVDLVGGVDRLLDAGVGTVIVTRGANGVSVTTQARDGSRPRETSHVPAFAVEAVDSTGAGDAFCGTLAAALANGIGMLDAVLRATAAGALATTVHGAVPSLPTAVQVDELLAR
jgi:ribokinase